MPQYVSHKWTHVAGYGMTQVRPCMVWCLVYSVREYVQCVCVLCLMSVS